MKYQEAKEILIEIQRLYPLFNKDRDIELARLWIERLQLGEYERTKKKLLDYSMESTYPPTLANILVREHKPVNTEASDIAAMEEAVRQERADPQKNAERAKALQEFNRRLEELEAHGRH